MAGILLAAPGILSDVAGLLLILPPVRAHLTRRMARSMRATADQRTRITVVTADEAGFTAQQWTASTRRDQQPSDPGRGEGGRPPVIQGEILPPPREGD